MDVTEAEASTGEGARPTTAEEGLRDAILRGELEPGATFSLPALATLVGFGRTPLREAIRALQRERLVVAEPFRRVRIADVTADDAEQLYAMRICLEGVAIRHTVPALTTDDVAELEGWMAQMDHYMRQEDTRSFRGPHLAFHARLVGSAGERVTDQIALLSAQAERYRTRVAGLRPELWKLRRTEHREILDAAAAGDAELAARALTRHYVHAAEVILDVLDPGRDAALLDAAHRVIASEAPPAAP